MGQQWPEVIKQSLTSEVQNDYIKKDGVREPENGISPNIEIHRLFGAVEFNGETYLVKTTIKYFTDCSSNNKAHSYEVIKIELLDESNSPMEPKQDSQTVSPIEAINLLQGVERSYKKGRFLLDDHSKVLDENGEPLVVYHGIDECF